MGSPGRPTKRTPETVKKLCDAIRLGASYGDACGFAGISISIFNEWRREHPDFRAEIESAEGAGRVQLIAKIQKAATDGNWQAAAWMLERRDPENYGRTNRTHLSVVRGREDAPDVEAMQAAAANGITASDAAVLWQRQLRVLELAFQRGEVDAAAYLAHMSRLTAEARHLADQRMRQLSPDGTPQVALSLTLDSTGIRDPAPLPAGVEPARRASAGGDLIDVG